MSKPAINGAQSIFRAREVMGISVVDRSRDIPGSGWVSRDARRVRRRAHECAVIFSSCLLAVMALAFVLQAKPAGAQRGSEAYRQTVLSIQKQIEDNNLNEAQALIAKAARQYPDDGGIENLLGIVDVEQGKASDARKAFSSAIRHDPTLASAYMNLSRLDMPSAATDEGLRAEALQLSEKAARLEPANDEANYQIATLYSWDKNFERSLAYLAKLSPEARRQVGAEALSCADEAALGKREATTQAAVLLAANPDLTEQDADASLEALRLARRADLIETVFAAADARHPLSAGGLRTLGLAQEANGKLPEARATLERAFTADNSAEIVLEDLARVAEAAKDDKGALGYLAHARDMRPNDARLPYEFGAICLKMNLYGESRKALEQAVQLAPDNPTYNLGLGTVVSFSDDPSQALPYLTKYHASRPQDPAGTLALGATYFRAKDYDNAAIWLKQAAAHARTGADAYFYLGRIAREEGRSEEAINDLKQSLALHPDQPDVLAELGQICVVTRNYPEATHDLNRALELEKDNYAANFGLLELYARTGDPRRAAQSQRFDEVKDKREQWDRDMMRVLVIRKDGDTNQPE